MKYTLDSICGGPKVRRLATAPPLLTGIEKEALAVVTECEEAKAMYAELTESFRQEGGAK
jgi:hypothetical protein